MFKDAHELNVIEILLSVCVCVFLILRGITSSTSGEYVKLKKLNFISPQKLKISINVKINTHRHIHNLPYREGDCIPYLIFLWLMHVSDTIF